MGREASISRMTKETEIQVWLDLDGSGTYQVDTGIPFFNHMLEQFAKHGFFDVQLKAVGDLQVDLHHTVEDVGIALGQAIAKAGSEKSGLRRFAEARVPLSEALVSLVLDLCGRPFLVFRGKMPRTKINTFDTVLVGDFFKALTDNSGLTLHVNIDYGVNAHHIVECIFKSFGRALHEATRIDERVVGVRSTKGQL
jgi:imidazoleglycerol-phosphate dehydratase